MRIDTLAVMRRSAASDDPLSGAAWAGCARVCRNIDVRRSLHRCYLEDWKAPEQPEPLGQAEWRDVIDLLLGMAACETSKAEEARGRRLKLVNTAWKALDLCTNPDGGDLAGWERLSARCRLLQQELLSGQVEPSGDG